MILTPEQLDTIRKGCVTCQSLGWVFCLNDKATKAYLGCLGSEQGPTPPPEADPQAFDIDPVELVMCNGTPRIAVQSETIREFVADMGYAVDGNGTMAFPEFMALVCKILKSIRSST